MIFIKRRQVLAGLGGGMLLSARIRALRAATPANLDKKPKFDTSPFQLGVASGDPSPDGFVIWTRLVPAPLALDAGMADNRPMLVDWQVGADETLSHVVCAGQALAHPELGHSVHVEVSGLKPDRPYWYRFRIAGYDSTIGRSHTFPLPGASPVRARFAAAGCQHYEQGYYTAWRRISEEPIDFVFHYGDYIYEGEGRKEGIHQEHGRPFRVLRSHVGPECYSLDEYRRRYAQYKADADLQAAHAAVPWIVTPDDHEVDNNWAGDTDQDGTPADIFRLRRASAMQAYYEHMPLRLGSLPDGSHMQIYRSLRYGDLMNIFLLDTRQYRSDQVYGDRMTGQGPDVWSPERTMMGPEQERWLFNGLAHSDTRWNLLAHQVMMMNLAFRKSDHGPVLYSMDQWSGYMYSRRRLLQFIERNCPGNVVNVTGDAHRHFAGNLAYDPGNARPVSVEFLATSITSGADGGGDDDHFSRSVRRENPQLLATTDQRGYVLCDVGRDVWHADLKVLDRVMERDGRLSTYASFAVARGHPGLQKA
ncbi:alkaline phosphatase [Novacetimonas maltaceti]|uniref:Alkaline phosphatase D n=1 Tax=Novacetimonas maltaceti TaxID=1203393 RepID=A0A2S3W079_9PROT|nr:alkaline phosphatase D family protein [Novacetimonas maltaceti]POF62270.1 Alkaline phosphatase D precursor [Novacetimonas maltaceti]PYD59246.1 alkaline phosphatase [Novacetimonas maltaceti]